MAYLTALFSQTNHFALGLIVGLVLVSILLYVRFEWRAVLVFSVILAFGIHLLWLFNNPILTKTIRIISEHHFNLMYLAAYAGLFSVFRILGRRNEPSSFLDVVVTLFNSSGLMLIGAINGLFFFKNHIPLLAGLTALFFLIMATANWLVLRDKYITSFYACFGYVALSVAIFAQFSSPGYFLWLALQSLLVISTAIWFRSKIIIVANVFIYSLIYLAYLFLSASNDWVNLGYAITAITSARVLNWKRQRLDLKTDFIRNIYLAYAFVIVLYGLFHAVPSRFVSLSWLGAALFYLGMSFLLRNRKYRYMAFLTILATVIHIFLIDMSRLGAGFRIILFLVVGFVILMLSLVYTRYRARLIRKE